MLKSRTITAGAALAACIWVAAAVPAGATISQTANVKILPFSGTLPAVGKSYVKIDAYLATRDPASKRTDKKANPVGTVKMTFPAGSTVNAAATPGCKLKGNASPALIRTTCATSQVGEGWALLNNLGTSPLSQLAEAPKACLASDTTQYTRIYATGAPTCTPRGFVWVHVRAYQGTGDGTRVLNHTAIIFANDNRIAPLSFAGSVALNVLAVQLPALGGTGSQPGELPLGAVLSDFKLVISKANYLKLGACPSTKRVNVSTYVKFSKFVRETTLAPPPVTVNYSSPCR